MSRRRARRQAFMTLYQSDVGGRDLDEMLDRWRAHKGELEEYAIQLTHGVRQRREELDARLTEVSEGWPVHRMSTVDRSILRLALYEMLYVEDVPQEVAVHEATELAKGFSGEEAPSFVSGVLKGAGGLVEHG